MLKSYFYIKRSLAELRPKLLSGKIFEIFTQEKDTVFFHVPDDSYGFAHLIISVNPQLSFLQYKKEFYKAKKNVTSFLNELLPLKIDDILIAEKDRIALILTEEIEIYVLFHGSKSNVIFMNKNGSMVLSFKKIKNPETVTKEIRENVFINPEEHYDNLTDLKINSVEELKEIRKEFPNISKEILEEVSYRYEGSGKKINYLLDEILQEIETGKIVTGYSEKEAKIKMLPANFRKASELTAVQTANSFNDALHNYLSLHYKFLRTLTLKKEIGKYLDRELDRLANKLNKLKGRIELGSRENEYNKFGTLLLNNRHLLKKGMKEIELEDYESGSKLLIKLDEKLSPQANIEKYFEKSRDEKINFAKSLELFDTTEKRFTELKQIKKKLEDTDDPEELNALKEKLKINGKEKVNKSENKFKFRRFLIENKYQVFVGKDSKSNDYLSIKFAKQNDYWFHARGLAGSHVVLRVDNPKEGVPKSILKKAASIAAYFSKGKTAGVTPVSYTLAKYVYKKKGMEPGKVMISKEKVLLVKPEIPGDCEQINE